MISPLYTLIDVTKEYNLKSGFFSSTEDKVLALQNLTFQIPKHSIFGIVGRSGSGKSTLMRLLTAAEHPSQGRILFHSKKEMEENENIDEIPNIAKFTTQMRRQYQSDVKIIFQDPARSLNPRLTIRTLLLQSLWYSNKFRQYCYANGLTSRRQRRKEIIHRAEDALSVVGLEPDMMGHFPTEFSGGQRQRIAIARALIHRPSVLICDEITSSLDVSNQKNIMQLLHSLWKKLQLTIIFVSHNLALIGYVCNHILVLDEGQVVEYGVTDEILNKPSHKMTKHLLDSVASLAERKT